MDDASYDASFSFLCASYTLSISRKLVASVKVGTLGEFSMLFAKFPRYGMWVEFPIYLFFSRIFLQNSVEY